MLEKRTMWDSEAISVQPRVLNLDIDSWHQADSKIHVQMGWARFPEWRADMEMISGALREADVGRTMD